MVSLLVYSSSPLIIHSPQNFKCVSCMVIPCAWITTLCLENYTHSNCCYVNVLVIDVIGLTQKHACDCHKAYQLYFPHVTIFGYSPLVN